MSKGYGLVRSVGWETEEEAKLRGVPKPRFLTIIEWVDGPPALPWSIIWKEVPVTIVPATPVPLQSAAKL